MIARWTAISLYHFPKVFTTRRQKVVEFSLGVCYNCPSQSKCRIRISVIQRLPKPWRRVRLPYPAPEKKHPLSTGQRVFLFNEINPWRDLWNALYAWNTPSACEMPAGVGGGRSLRGLHPLAMPYPCQRFQKATILQPQLRRLLLSKSPRPIN